MSPPTHLGNGLLDASARKAGPVEATGVCSGEGGGRDGPALGHEYSVFRWIMHKTNKMASPSDWKLILVVRPPGVGWPLLSSNGELHGALASDLQLES